jgi:hypothetical protein
MKQIISNSRQWGTCVILLAGMLTAAMLPVQKGYSQNLIRVYFHICRNDDGTNAAATETQIQSEFNQLAADYAPGNICFVNMGLEYINSTTLNNNMSSDIGSLLALYLVPDCLNIFYRAVVEDGDLGGKTYYKSDSVFCSIARGNIGFQTISHEIGHCFGLLDTYDTAHCHINGKPCYEAINGDNLVEAGDQIKDTPADPYAYKGQSCFATNFCCYIGFCTDPNGQSNFTPPYTNLMAAWWQFGYGNLTLTPGQYEKVNDNLLHFSALKAWESPVTFTFGPATYTSDYHMLSAINTLTTFGNVNLGGTTVTTLGGGLVLLEPGFNANASGGALILVLPAACIAGALRSVSQTNSAISSATAVISKTNSNTLKCYPNPFSQRFTVEFNLANNDAASIKLYDLMGKQLMMISNAFFTKGSHEVNANVSGLPAGIYIVVLQTAKFKNAQKIVKIN